MSLVVEIIESLIGKQPPEIESWLAESEIISATLGDSFVESSLTAKIPMYSAFNSFSDKLIVEEIKRAPEPKKIDIPDRHEKQDRGEQLSLF